MSPNINKVKIPEEDYLESDNFSLSSSNSNLFEIIEEGNANQVAESCLVLQIYIVGTETDKYNNCWK